MWISRAKIQILDPTQLFIIAVFYKVKPMQNTTNITEITENSLKLSTSHNKQIQIGQNFSPIVYSTKSTKSDTSHISRYCFNTECFSHMQRSTK